jgi:hypothetical protein
MEKAPNGPASPESKWNIQSEILAVEMAVTKRIRNTYSSLVDLVGTNNVFIRHRGWRFLPST